MIVEDCVKGNPSGNTAQGSAAIPNAGKAMSQALLEQQNVKKQNANAGLKQFTCKLLE
jgi:hypothetical protein